MFCYFVLLFSLFVILKHMDCQKGLIGHEKNLIFFSNIFEKLLLGLLILVIILIYMLDFQF